MTPIPMETGIDDAEDSDPADPTVCSDVDADGCDDCSSSFFNPPTMASTPTATDSVTPETWTTTTTASKMDSIPIHYIPQSVRTWDADTCDDCSQGPADPNNDGLDTDADGLCDLGDTDDDKTVLRTGSIRIR